MPFDKVLARKGDGMKRLLDHVSLAFTFCTVTCPLLTVLFAIDKLQ